MAQVDDLTAQLMAELSKYTVEVAEEVKQACKDVSKEMTENIKRDSPVRAGAHGGGYKKGWKAKVAFEDKNNIRITTYNSTDYQLTHLLEFGHAKVNGGRVEGKPHIAPNEEKAKTELVKRIEKAVSAK